MTQQEFAQRLRDLENEFISTTNSRNYWKERADDEAKMADEYYRQKEGFRVELGELKDSVRVGTVEGLQQKLAEETTRANQNKDNVDYWYKAYCDVSDQLSSEQKAVVELEDRVADLQEQIESGVSGLSWGERDDVYREIDCALTKIKDETDVDFCDGLTLQSIFQTLKNNISSIIC